MPRSATVRLLLLAQLSLFIFLAICFVLIPHFLLEPNEGGVSNYGTYAKTVVPYTLGFGLCGVLTILASRSLPRMIARRRTLRWVFLVLGVLYLVVLLSTYPYRLNHMFDVIHIYLGTALVLYSTALSIWLTFALLRSRVTFVLLACELVGFILSVLTFLGHLHVLFVAEILTSAAFGTLLVRSTSDIRSS